jgi:hypothetical protein
MNLLHFIAIKLIFPQVFDQNPGQNIDFPQVFDQNPGRIPEVPQLPALKDFEREVVQAS